MGPRRRDAETRRTPPSLRQGRGVNAFSATTGGIEPPTRGFSDDEVASIYSRNKSDFAIGCAEFVSPHPEAIASCAAMAASRSTGAIRPYTRSTMRPAACPSRRAMRAGATPFAPEPHGMRPPEVIRAEASDPNPLAHVREVTTEGCTAVGRASPIRSHTAPRRRAKARDRGA
jgi:hypothetical protein